MRTAEKIQREIDNNFEEIEHLKQKILKMDLKNLQEEIKNHSNEAEYVASWIESWIKPIIEHKKEIERLKKDIGILQWILKNE